MKIEIGLASQTAAITDRIKSPEDAFKALGIPKPSTLDFPDEMQGIMGAAAAFIKLAAITEALNEGWVPDWSNEDQPKYYPWFDMRGDFSLYGVDDDYYRSRVSSRLCFKSRELARYAATQFLDLYKDYYLVA